MRSTTFENATLSVSTEIPLSIITRAESSSMSKRGEGTLGAEIRYSILEASGKTSSLKTALSEKNYSASSRS